MVSLVGGSGGQPASASQAGVVTTGTQTFAGAKTFTGHTVLANSQLDFSDPNGVYITAPNVSSSPGVGAVNISAPVGLSGTDVLLRLTDFGDTTPIEFTTDGNITATNVSGINTGNVTLAAIGSSANANGASLSGQALNLQPASGSFGGVVTTGAQTFAGVKTFSSGIASTIASTGAALTVVNDNRIINAAGSFIQMGEFGTTLNNNLNLPRLQLSAGGDITYINNTADHIGLNGNWADSGSAVAVAIDNGTALTLAGAKLLSIRNATVEKAFVDYNGMVCGAYGVQANTSAALPSASATYRGTLWLDRGGAGVADILKVCIKNAADTYEWKTVTLA